MARRPRDRDGLRDLYVFNATLLKGVVRPWIGMDSTLDRAIYFVIAYTLWMANGWVIAKLHRPVTAMVLAYVLWAIVASVPPVYAVVSNILGGSAGASALAWEVTVRMGTLLMLMTGGLLSTYRDQIKRTRVAGQEWRGRSPRLAAR